jgi:hypothetical protein
MHSNKISANLQNDILKVLRGETVSKTELPTAIMEAAKQASIDLGHAFLDEGYLSAERRRDILRRNLAEGLKKCGCTPTTEMINRYEEEASKPVQAEETKKEEVVDEAASDMMLRSWIRNNHPSADNAKFNKILAAMQKQYSKDPKGYTYGGGFSKVAKDAGIK